MTFDEMGHVPSLNASHQVFSQSCPLAKRLLEPKRFVLNGARGERYFSPLCGFVSDVYSTRMACQLMAPESGGVGAYETGMHYLLFQKLWADHGAQCYFVAEDLCDQLLDTEPPVSMSVEDIRWPFPAMRVFLPKNALMIDGMPVPFLDMALFPVGLNQANRELITDMCFDLIRPGNGFVQANMDQPRLSITYPNPNDKEWGHRGHVHIGMSDTVDSILDQASAMEGGSSGSEMRTVIALALNIVMTMTWLPDEIENETLARKARTNNKGEIVRTELWEPRFIGRQVFKTPKTANPDAVSTGITHGVQDRKAHWKRQPFGPKQSKRKTIWISPYRTRSREERGLPPES